MSQNLFKQPNTFSKILTIQFLEYRIGCQVYHTSITFKASPCTTLHHLLLSPLGVFIVTGRLPMQFRSSGPFFKPLCHWVRSSILQSRTFKTPPGTPTITTYLPIITTVIISGHATQTILLPSRTSPARFLFSQSVRACVKQKARYFISNVLQCRFAPCPWAWYHLQHAYCSISFKRLPTLQHKPLYVLNSIYNYARVQNNACTAIFYFSTTYTAKAMITAIICTVYYFSQNEHTPSVFENIFRELRYA